MNLMSDNQLPKKKDENTNDLFNQWFQFHPIFQERPFRNILENIDYLFNQPLLKPNFKVRLKEDEENYEVYAELPGITKNQIHINTMPYQVTIMVENKQSETFQDDSKHYMGKKDAYQYMKRTIPFYHPVIVDQAIATFQNGLLKITLPKQKGKNIFISEEK